MPGKECCKFSFKIGASNLSSPYGTTRYRHPFLTIKLTSQIPPGNHTGESDTRSSTRGCLNIPRLVEPSTEWYIMVKGKEFLSTSCVRDASLKHRHLQYTFLGSLHVDSTCVYLSVDKAFVPVPAEYSQEVVASCTPHIVISFFAVSCPNVLPSRTVGLIYSEGDRSTQRTARIAH